MGFLAVGDSMACLSGRMLIGAGPAPGSGLRVTREMLVKPSGSFSARLFRSKIFLTSESVRAILGSGFMVKVSGAQNSKGVLGLETVTDGKTVSSNLQF